MTRVENHKLREDNLSKLREYERLNISFDILSRVAFIINATKQQPVLEITTNGTILCTYELFKIEVKSSSTELLINGKTIIYDGNEIITRVRELTE